MRAVPFAMYAASGNNGPQGLQGDTGATGPSGPQGRARVIPTPTVLDVYNSATTITSIGNTNGCNITIKKLD